MTILVVILIFILIITDFGLKVDETADGSPPMASLNPNKHGCDCTEPATERAP